MASVTVWQNPRATTRWMFMTTTLAAIAMLQLAGYDSRAHAAEGLFLDFPFLVHCELSGVDRAYYLSRIDADGVAVYLTPDNQAGTITIKGKAEPVGGDWAGSCAGKTLEQLRSTGQAYYLQR